MASLLKRNGTRFRSIQFTILFLGNSHTPIEYVQRLRRVKVCRRSRSETHVRKAPKKKKKKKKEKEKEKERNKKKKEKNDAG